MDRSHDSLLFSQDEEQQRELDRELLPVPELTDVASVSSCDSSGLSTLAPTLSSGNASMSPKAAPRLEALRRTGQNSRKALTDRLGGLSNSVLKRGLLASVSTQLRASKAKMGSPTCIVSFVFLFQFLLRLFHFFVPFLLSLDDSLSNDTYFSTSSISRKFRCSFR